jgi:hypothetical protein
MARGRSALSGAATGAMLGTALPGVGTAIGAGLGGIAGWLMGGDDDQEEYQKQVADQRARSKAAQMGYVDSMQGPTLSDSMRRRIAALEDESKATPLVEDPYFQGQRATAVQGGQKALSQVDNAHAAYGTSGGFSNQGSAQDAYDRLSGQLAGLGEASTKLKSQKADQAAQMQQGILDAQTAFHNAQAQARAAIEAGDSATAMQAINAAYAAKQKESELNQQMMGSLLSAGATVYGASLKAPAAAVPAASASPGPVASGAPLSYDTPDSWGKGFYDSRSLPYAAIRRGMS